MMLRNPRDFSVFPISKDIEEELRAYKQKHPRTRVYVHDGKMDLLVIKKRFGFFVGNSGNPATRDA